MIDIHVHILPRVDDGPRTLQEALLLASALVQEGVYAAVATPHYNDEFTKRPVAEIRERVSNLQQELNRHAIPLHLFAGHEVLIQPGIIEDIYAGRIATVNGSRYLLLELWNTSWLPETERILFELLAYGIVPIIAHPERYRAIQKDVSRLVRLRQQGVVIQITAGSLLGRQGNTAKQCAEKMLKQGLVDIIASDAHNVHNRLPTITNGLQSMKKICDYEQIDRMIEKQPYAIVKNELLYTSRSFESNTGKESLKK